MEPIKCWIAQDLFEDRCYVYNHQGRPQLDEKDDWQAISPYWDYLDKNLLGKVDCIECVIITKEEYERLKNNGTSSI